MTVLRVHGEMPFKFSLAMPVAAGGAKGWSVELQAENEDVRHTFNTHYLLVSNRNQSYLLTGAPEMDGCSAALCGT